MRSIFGQIVAIILAAVLTGCATTQENGPADPGAYEEIADPFEPINRVTFKFNRVVETVAVRPVATVYRTIVPSPIRDMISNFLKNISAPVVLFNDILQGKPKRAGNTFARLVINSTIGLGGLFDAANDFGIEGHSEDFGQTLAVWGIGNGPYIVLPLLGPSSLRDTIGRAGNVVMDPLFWGLTGTKQDYLRFVQRGAEGVELYERNMEEIDELKRTSIDYYIALRSTYTQNRADAIRDGADIVPEIPDYFDEVDENDAAEERLATEIAARIVAPIDVDARLTEDRFVDGW